MVRPIRIVMVIAALVALLAGGVAIQAQGGGGGRDRGRGGFGPGGGPGAGLALRGLTLTEAQREQVRSVMEQYRPQFQALNDQVERDIRAILTPEQQQQADTLRADREARLKQQPQRRQPRPQQ